MANAGLQVQSTTNCYDQEIGRGSDEKKKDVLTSDEPGGVPADAIVRGYLEKCCARTNCKKVNETNEILMWESKVCGLHVSTIPRRERTTAIRPFRPRRPLSSR